MKQIATALAPSRAFVNSAQAAHSVPEVEFVKTENQRLHFRRVTVNQVDANLAVSGRMDAGLRYYLPRAMWASWFGSPITN